MELRLQDLPTQASVQIPNVGAQRVYEYLGKRGIKTAREIDQLRLRVLRCIDIGKIGDDRAAIVFPHFDMSGNEIDWWSARLVDLADPTGFQALVPKSRGKMYCPPKEAPAAYLVPTLNWAEMPEGAEIFIHESCIKAYVGAKCGRYSIGLNGVWGWGSKKNDIALVSQIRDLPWAKKKLKCIVIFDSNAEDNDQVALAIRVFAERMRLICKVEVQHHLLPKSPEGENWGFDDFVERHGIDAGREFLDSDDGRVVVDLSETETLKLQLNDEVCVVKSMSRIARQSDGHIMSLGDFTGTAYADYVVYVERETRMQRVNIPKEWIQWSRRTVVDRLDYIPGAPKIHDGCLNTWRPSDLEPVRGDASKWLHILETRIPDERIREWVISWLAYPIQHMGEKLMTFLHIYGPQGMGKQAILKPIFRIYGEGNTATVTKDQMTSDFNSMFEGKQLINFDEGHEGGGGHSGHLINNKLKGLVTGESMVINKKGVPQYVIRNVAQWVTTGNYVDSIKLDEDDRRACVINFGVDGQKFEEKWWEEYYQWAESDEGAGALYAFLLEWDTSRGGFNPKGHAPFTAAKKMVTEAGRSTYEQWVRDLIEDPDSRLLPILKGAAVVTGKQLAASYKAGDETERSVHSLIIALGRVLASLNVPRIEIKVNGAKERVWIIRQEARNWDLDRLRRAFCINQGKV